MNGKIAIVIPVYNVAPYLRRCVQSVLHQTYGDFRAILVDDCSSDESLSICKKLVRSNPGKVDLVVRTENGGLSAARNSGICHTLSFGDCDWLSFLDSDDWLCNTFLERMLAGAQACKADISVCGYIRTDGTTECDLRRNIDFRPLSPEEFWRACDEWKEEHAGLFIQNIACAKLFKTSLFAELRFPDGVRAHEDVYTTYKAVFAANRIAFSKEPLYHYFQNPESITGRKWTKDRLHTVWGHAEQIDFFETHGFNTALEIAVKQQLRRIGTVIRKCNEAGWNASETAPLFENRASLFLKYSNRFKLPLSEFPDVWRQVRPLRAKFFYPALALRIGPRKTMEKVIQRLRRRLKLRKRNTRIPNASCVGNEDS